MGQPHQARAAAPLLAATLHALGVMTTEGDVWCHWGVLCVWCLVVLSIVAGSYMGVVTGLGCGGQTVGARAAGACVFASIVDGLLLWMALSGGLAVVEGCCCHMLGKQATLCSCSASSCVAAAASSLSICCAS